MNISYMCANFGEEARYNMCEFIIRELVARVAPAARVKRELDDERDMSLWLAHNNSDKLVVMLSNQLNSI